MGTRSLTYISESKTDKPFVCFYRQFDGYPTGLGDEIAKFTGNRRLVNGYNPAEANKVFNGMGDMAAMLIWHLKAGEIGNVYIESTEPDPNGWQEYEYYLYPVGNDIYIRCHECYGAGRDIYEGPASEFNGEAIEGSASDD